MTIDSRPTQAIDLGVRFPDFPAAACADSDVDPEVFFPKAGGGYETSVAYAKGICRGCPEELRCLTWALDNDAVGVWGGMSDLERRAVRRGKAPITCAACGIRFPDPGRQGGSPRRCALCRARRDGR